MIARISKRIDELVALIDPTPRRAFLIGADRAECERKLAALVAAGKTPHDPMLVITGVPRAG